MLAESTTARKLVDSKGAGTRLASISENAGLFKQCLPLGSAPQWSVSRVEHCEVEMPALYCCFTYSLRNSPGRSSKLAGSSSRTLSGSSDRSGGVFSMAASSMSAHVGVDGAVEAASQVSLSSAAAVAVADMAAAATSRCSRAAAASSCSRYALRRSLADMAAEDSSREPSRWLLLREERGVAQKGSELTSR